MSRKSERLQKQREQRYRDDLKWLVSDARGRRLVWNILQNNHYARPLFNGNSRDALVIGRQIAATEIINDIKLVSLDAVHLMEREAIEDERQNALQQQGDDDADE